MATAAASNHTIVPASATRSLSTISQAELNDFHTHLRKSTRILALLGAGLSASSGLPTFRGAGGLWRTYDAMELATPEAFESNPGLVWQFYSYRRHMALRAKPNKAHYALAELAKNKPGFVTLSQNVDGLSQRAGHPRETLNLLHGSLYDIKCSSFYCDYTETDNFTDPIVPSLTIPTIADLEPNSEAARKAMDHAFNEKLAPNGISSVSPTDHADQELDIADENVSLPELSTRDLPHCPKCKTGLLRPGVVWFGETLPSSTLAAVDDFLQAGRVDLILVVGTSSRVYPAAGYTDAARSRGARVAIINKDKGDVPASGLTTGDWFFEGDAAEVLPLLLEPVVGDVSDRVEV